MWQANTGAMGGYGGGGDGSGGEEELSAKIKALQRNDPVAKEQWTAFTDAHGQGRRDPTKHSPEFLLGFLEHYNSGRKLPPQEDGSELAVAVKSLQKKSQNFKNVWAQYCGQFGGGKNDPARHDPTFLVRFFEFLAQNTSFGMQMQMPAGAPPMKRQRMDAPMGFPAIAGSGDPMKDQLAEQVKAFQRKGEIEKETWGRHADQYLGGVRDPMRHDAASLQEFLQTHNIQTSGVTMRPTSIKPSYAPPAAMMDPNKENLVNRIKTYQKTSKDAQAEWANFAGSTRDPARHETSKLQEFCDAYQLP